ncbi:MAG: hypothetical protein ACFFER_13930 [Candidatus Thorarchaeota archaeon]
MRCHECTQEMEEHKKKGREGIWAVMVRTPKDKPTALCIDCFRKLLAGEELQTRGAFTGWWTTGPKDKKKDQ